jgi:hypothetical protein
MGGDLWEAAFERLTSDPLDPHLYWNLMQSEDGDRIRRVIAFAESNLPLDEIAIGPSNLMGLGPAYVTHRCLDFLVQEMRREAVFSPRLVASALRSLLVQNRNMAVAALENHPIDEWGPSLIGDVMRATADEPDDQVRDRMKAVMARAR